MPVGGKSGDSMLLNEQIAQTLANLKGLATNDARTVSWTADGGISVEIDFTAVDSLGCTIRELRLSSERFSQVPFETLKTWADDLCQKVIYLLEKIGALERDPVEEAVLIRSI